MSAKPYRYQLPQKAIKSDCPDCGPKHRRTLSRYVDTQTGEPLPDIYGRCDRESNCGYHWSPYSKAKLGMSYADEVYQQWKQENQRPGNYSRPKFTSPAYATPIVSPKSSTIITEAPIYSIPDELVKKSLGHYHQNQFARLLRDHFGLIIADELLHRFHIGTSKCWNDAGACVFWLIDEQGRNRGGQVKLFDDAFHTVKYVDREGQTRTRTNWVHSILRYSFDQQQLPKWLTDYIEQNEFAPCLFGLPQLLTAPADKPIAIVEAPKTAVLATPYFPQFVWLAVIGRSYLNTERLASIKGRNVVLFPDLAIEGKDYEYWKGKADGLRQQGFNVVISDWLEQLATDEERVKGFDMADYLLNQWKGYPPSWDIATSSLHTT